MLQPYTTMNKNTAVMPTNAAALARIKRNGEEANARAAAGVFDEYNLRKAKRTIAIHGNTLRLFAEYLVNYGIHTSGEALQTGPHAWKGIRWGMVKEFTTWAMITGHALTTVNLMLSGIKVYAGLAAQAGGLDDTEYRLIRSVKGYSGKDAHRLDERREENDVATRKGNKKEDFHVLTPAQIRRLKAQCDRATPQGQRDLLLLCIMIDHGLRVGEVAALEVSAFNLADGTMTFYRPKVDRIQTMKLSKDTAAAARDWFESGNAPAAGKLLRGSRKGGHLTDAGMSERAITKRVRYFGQTILGIDDLSAHDCRHTWATNYVRASIEKTGTVDIFRLQEAGGWASLAMPRRYVEWAKIANADWIYGDTQITEEIAQ